jgi:hypothetical protein
MAFFSGFFPVGTLERARFYSPRIIKDLVTKLQAVVWMVDANMLRHIQENAMQRTVVCLEIDRGRFKHSL